MIVPERRMPQGNSKITCCADAVFQCRWVLLLLLGLSMKCSQYTVFLVSQMDMIARQTPF